MSPLDPGTQQLLEQIIDRLDVVLRKQDEQDARLRSVETSVAEIREWKRVSEGQYPDLAKRVNVVEIAGGSVRAKAAIIWAVVNAFLAGIVAVAVSAARGSGPKP